MWVGNKVRPIYIVINHFYVHFFTCIKKRTKESAAVHLSAFGGFPALLEFVGSLKTRPALRDSNSSNS